MQLRQIGELRLLQEIRKRFSATDSTIVVNIGDDAAVIAPQKEKIIVTTDMMNEGIHFDLSYTSAFHIGFKLVSVNVSDIFAMGGIPKYLFLNMAIKKDLEEEIFWKLYDGISHAIDVYRISLAGGDLCAAKNEMVVSATVIGYGDKTITRGGASIGDKIYVTGNLGDSACGLEILKRLVDESKDKVRRAKLEILSKEFSLKLLTSQVIDWNIAEPLIRRHLMPVARDSEEIKRHATSMIDISDGLFIDLCRICDESNVGARIYLDRIPISDSMKIAAGLVGLDPLHLAISGGEDYELLFTASEEFEVSGQRSGTKMTCIGEVIEKDRIVVGKNGVESELKIEGYQHFGNSR